MRGLALIDVDGTLSDFRHREHLVKSGSGSAPPDQKAWDLFIHPEMLYKDPVYPNCERVLKELGQTHDLVFLTGRNAGLSQITCKWLWDKMGLVALPDINLFMRPIGNKEAPSVYKAKQISKIIDGFNYHSILAMDDDKYMFEIYRSFGALTLKAPECWGIMLPEVGKLPPEQSWRK
jgi:hypothetical protein